MSSPTIDPELQGLLRGVIAEPDEVFPRLVLADWFDEQGDVRGDFIRTEIEFASQPRTPEDIGKRSRDPQYGELRASAIELWMQELPSREGIDNLNFHRGLPSFVSMSIESFLEIGPALIEQVPTITGLRNTDFVHMWPRREMSRRLGELLSSEVVSNLSILDFKRNRLGNPEARMLSRSRQLAGLNQLWLSGNRLNSAAVASLTESTSLVNLISLDLAGNQINETGAEILADSELLAGLFSLDLGANHIRDDGVASLANSPFSRRLRLLRLSRAELGDRAVLAIAESESLTGLQELNLASNAISVTAAMKIVEPGRLPNLKLLNLEGNLIEKDDQEQLRAMAPFPIVF